MSTTIRLIAASAVVAFAGSAMAFVPWSNPSGSGANFSWDNGGSREGLFGSPSLVDGNTFVFFPSAFRAQAVSGQTNIKGDRLEFDLFANEGFSITGLRIEELGDYGIIGEGSSVAAAGSLIMTRLNDSLSTVFDPIVTTPGSPITEEGFGNWRGVAGVDVSQDSIKWTRVHVVIDNDLIAIAGQGGVAFIEKKVFGSGISITVVPTPGSAALVAAGSVLAFRRRR